MRKGGRVALVIAGLAIATMALAVTLFWGLSGPIAGEACAVGFESCRAAAGGFLDAVDCRIEMLHCRAHGPEHWLDSHRGAAGSR